MKFLSMLALAQVTLGAEQVDNRRIMCYYMDDYENTLFKVNKNAVSLTDGPRFQTASGSYGKLSVPDGMRHIYIDELFGCPDLWNSFKYWMSDWAIAAVWDGWTEGTGYGSKRVKDYGERKTSWNFVNRDYPVCDAVAQNLLQGQPHLDAKSIY